MATNSFDPRTEIDVAANAAQPFQVGDWLIDPMLRCAQMGDVSAKIEPRNLRVLQVLASRPGEIVSARDIESLAWSGFVVTPDSLYQSIRQLRQLLGDTKSPATYIETVPRRGYRLVAPVAAAPSWQGDKDEDQRPMDEMAAGPSLVPAVTHPTQRGGVSIQIRTLAVLATLVILCCVVGAGYLWIRPSFLTRTGAPGDNQSDAIGLFRDLENLDVLSLRNQGKAIFATGRPREALPYLEKALQVQLRNTGEDSSLAIELLSELALVHLWLDDDESARNAANRALSHLDQLAPADLTRFQLAVTMADVFTAMGDYEVAERLANDILPKTQARFGDQSLSVALAQDSRALVRWAQGRLDEAESLQRDAIRLYFRHRGALDPGTANARAVLGDILLDRGQLISAETELRTALDVLERTTRVGHPYRLSAQHYLAEVLVRTGRLDEAEGLLNELLDAHKKTDAVDWRVGRSMSVLAESFMRRGKYAEAERYLTLAKSKMTRTKGWPIEREVRNLNSRLAMLSELRAQSSSVAKL